MEPAGPSRLQVTVPLRTMLLATAVVLVAAAVVSITSAILVVFLGIFLALVFEMPTRLLERHTRLSRGLAATIVVLGSAVAAALLALLLLVPFVGSIRDFLKDLPQLVEDLRESGELDFVGDTGAANNVQDGANNLAERIPDAISAVLGVAGSAFSVFLTAFTLIFVALFLLSDIGNLKRAAASVLAPGQAETWLGMWERVTVLVSRWAIGVVVIATIAGTVQGTTAYLLGSSYALALGVIAGLLDMIPNLGATIAGFILVPVLWAEEGVTAAVIMLVVVLVYQQVENNLLTPTIQGKAVNISGFFVIIGVTLFGALLGVVGALIAVPVTATLQVIVIEATKTRRAQMAAAKAALEPAAAVSTPAAAPTAD